MLKCENIRPQISAYLDREMPAWRVQLVRWHLKRCPTCAHETMRLQQTDKFLRTLTPVKTSDNFLPDLMLRVSAASVTEKQRIPLLQRTLRKFKSSLDWAVYSVRMHTPTYAVGIALALMITVAGVTMLYPPLNSPTSSEETQVLTKSQEDEFTIIPIEMVSINYPKRPLRLNMPSPEE
jgi:anti-sigma factor RsiW